MTEASAGILAASGDFDRRYAAACTALEADSRRRSLPGQASLNGAVADFSHNDYLGLARDADAIAALCATAQASGVGATGSRLLSGDWPEHAALEAAIAAAKGTEAALVFPSGYQANATALAALLDRKTLGAEPLLFADRLNHASLHHACQLAGVHQLRFRHNDLGHLRELLQKHAGDVRPKFIVAETIFGMDGDALDMPALAALADEFGAFLWLDEAHATGVAGATGQGLASGWIGGRGAAMGTFSKAIGAQGAYVACSRAVRDYLLNRCTGFIYSTAIAPPLAAAVLAVWNRLPGMDARRAALTASAEALRKRLQAGGLDTGTSTTHIVPVIVGSDARALELKAWLAARGLVVSAVRPPTVPPNTARIRIALAASHTATQIDALAGAILDWRATQAD
ncbi:aminotransferase class I/II-fold pyridoxal phosphate-dependent enzyme [Derxia lacustris]|uniref:aminotransferase class I/II-fold pyridoxal phosphate-dependent enzyme n=1 Tax=Derxia lacustris TaxID=764842 RepID=UPI000A16FA9A|nr:aminotransferase class I/II-fold pyridoxal phosphate-dependent enzyme [Derxia lacustris]